MESSKGARPNPTIALPLAVSPGRLRLLVTAPKMAVSLLVLAVMALLWAVQKSEYEEQRTTLISDVLWLEQNLRFELNTSQEKIQQTAATIATVRYWRLRYAEAPS